MRARPQIFHRTPRPSKWDKLSTNPLVLLVMGFLLTGIVGTLLSATIEGNRASSERETQRAQALLDRRQQALVDFTKLIYDRRTKAGMLKFAIDHGYDNEQLRRRKILYDTSYIDWNANLQVNSLFIRGALNEKSFSAYERAVQFSLGRALYRLDACLDDAWDAKVLGKPTAEIFVSCNFQKYYQMSLDCGYSITEGLFSVINESDYIKATTPADIAGKTINQIKEFCPIPIDR